MKKYLNRINKDIFDDLAKSILSFIYPENISCIMCNLPIKTTNTYSMCKSCFDELHFIVDGCFKCGNSIINFSLDEQEFINTCSYCTKKSFYFDRAISCIEYNDFSKKIVFDLKYNKKTYMSKYIANIMKDKININNIQFDYILFVPIHKKRLRKRGFNQAKKIAYYLGELLNKPVLDSIFRIENTKQLYSLNQHERKKELKNAFNIDFDNINIKNKNIVLVDDIFTTGSTVNEISKKLKINGVNKIYILTLLTRGNNIYS